MCVSVLGRGLSFGPPQIIGSSLGREDVAIVEGAGSVTLVENHSHFWRRPPDHQISEENIIRNKCMDSSTLRSRFLFPSFLDITFAFNDE